MERGDIGSLVGERAHPVGGEEAGEDASVLVVGHAVHEGDGAEAEQLGNAVTPQETQDVLLLEGGVRRVGEGVQEELEIALGPGILVEVAEDWQEEVAELGSNGRERRTLGKASGARSFRRRRLMPSAKCVMWRGRNATPT